MSRITNTSRGNCPINCTCSLHERAIGSTFLDGETNVCFVEGSNSDKMEMRDMDSIAENVWSNVKPPKNLGTSMGPLVSARRIDIIRGQLTGKIRVNNPMADIQENVASSTPIIKKSVTKVSYTSISY